MLFISNISPFCFFFKCISIILIWELFQINVKKQVHLRTELVPYKRVVKSPQRKQPKKQLTLLSMFQKKQ